MTASRLGLTVAVLAALGSARPLQAQIGVGTWVKKATESQPGMTLKVENCCGGGRRLIYSIDMGSTAMSLTLDSPFDGTDAPVLINGQPSGQTMAIKRVDDHHLISIIKLNGKQFATARGTLSADGKTLTVVNDVTSAVPGQAVGKTTEVWVKQ
jgi:hypothetical protein